MGASNHTGSLAVFGVVEIHRKYLCELCGAVKQPILNHAGMAVQMGFTLSNIVHSKLVHPKSFQNTISISHYKNVQTHPQCMFLTEKLNFFFFEFPIVGC